MARTLCLVFDMDDTLFLEREYARSGFEAVEQHVVDRYGLTGFADRAQHLFDIGRRKDIFQVVLDAQGVKYDDREISALVQIYREHRPRISILPDAADCLLSFKAAASLGLITDGPVVSQIGKYLTLSLDSFIDNPCFTDYWGISFRKPHPRAFEWMQEKVATASRYVYVGDNPRKDFCAPRALGWTTVRVRRPEGLHFACEAEVNCMPDYEIPDLSALGRII